MNRMTRSTLLLCITLCGLLLAACDEPEPVIAPHSRPVKTFVVHKNANSDSRRFPATVDAIRKADISFRVSGKINRILVKEGELVKKGQLLATLDDTDFRITLKDREASFKTAEANYERAKTLVEKGAISRADHDKIRADYFTAKAGLAEARQELAYTRLKASFDGYIAKRYVENYEEVLASQKIFALEDTSELKLIIDVPENLMIAIDKQRNGPRRLYARFDAIPGQTFPLRFVEATTKADVTTKTFKVTLKMQPPERFNILPGMTATVYAEIKPGEDPDRDTMVRVPVAAVVANNEKKPVVWIVDEKTMTVHPLEVTTGFLDHGQIMAGGIPDGARIVTAGAAFLRDNMKVTLLRTGEQPE